MKGLVIQSQKSVNCDRFYIYIFFRVLRMRAECVLFRKKTYLSKLTHFLQIGY